MPDEQTQASEEVMSSASGVAGEFDELRRELAEAQPRLAAFAALEALAEEQGTTPEAIAIQASIEVLQSEEAERRDQLATLEAAILDADKERRRNVEARDELIEEQEKVRAELVIVLDEHTSVVDQMAEMIDELESIRADAIRLLGEKAELELKVEALRNEADALSGDVARLPRQRPVIESDDDEATAFDRFFEAEVEEDKSRAWMLE